MKKGVIWILSAILLVLFIFSARIMYNKYKDTSSGNLTIHPPATESDSSENLKPAPDFTVENSDGLKTKLSDFKGKPVVINFWATWCYYCKEEMPDFQKASEKYPDVQFMMINATDGVSETKESAKEYITNNGFSFDVFYDTSQSAVGAYSVNAFPATFFIDKDGNIAAYANGMIDFETLESAIARITA